VLDIGGHIGLFSRYAANRGAGYVLAIEPHPGNCDMFMLNLKNYDCVELIEAAVVSNNYKQKTMKLYESNTDTSAHSLVPTRGRNKMVVNTIHFGYALVEAQPSVVKIDIEGYEYDLQDEILGLFPKNNIKSFAIEFHLNRKDWRQKAREFVKQIEKIYKPVRIANITERAWNATGVWCING